LLFEFNQQINNHQSSINNNSTIEDPKISNE